MSEGRANDSSEIASLNAQVKDLKYQND